MFGSLIIGSGVRTLLSAVACIMVGYVTCIGVRAHA
jgi:hypothetical protein